MVEVEGRKDIEKDVTLVCYIVLEGIRKAMSGSSWWVEGLSTDGRMTGEKWENWALRKA